MATAADGEHHEGRKAMTKSETAAYVASHTPMCLSWHNVKYTVELSQGIGKPKKELEILHGLSGAVRPGDMLAIIGGSGAGKVSVQR